MYTCLTIFITLLAYQIAITEPANRKIKFLHGFFKNDISNSATKQKQNKQRENTKKK